ncbi:MAG: SDR family NAD(P)-dependent oxidoreductase, partial [Pseudomonadota bacterium]
MQLTFFPSPVLVTGAAQGIGFAIARMFREAGCAVTVADIDGERLRDGARLLGVDARVIDLGDRAAVHAVFD